MTPAALLMSLLVSSIPQEERAPSPSSLTALPSAKLLIPTDVPPSSSHGLLSGVNAAGLRSYPRFLIVRQGGEQLEGNDGVVVKDHFQGTTTDGQSIDVPVSDIKTLYARLA